MQPATIELGVLEEKRCQLGKAGQVCKRIVADRIAVKVEHEQLFERSKMPKAGVFEPVVVENEHNQLLGSGQLAEHFAGDLRIGEDKGHQAPLFVQPCERQSLIGDRTLLDRKRFEPVEVPQVLQAVVRYLLIVQKQVAESRDVQQVSQVVVGDPIAMIAVDAQRFETRHFLKEIEARACRGAEVHVGDFAKEMEMIGADHLFQPCGATRAAGNSASSGAHDKHCLVLSPKVLDRLARSTNVALELFVFGFELGKGDIGCVTGLTDEPCAYTQHRRQNQEDQSGGGHEQDSSTHPLC